MIEVGKNRQNHLNGKMIAAVNNASDIRMPGRTMLSGARFTKRNWAISSPIGMRKVSLNG